MKNLLLFGLLPAALLTAQPVTAAPEVDLAAVRAATQRFQDVDVALAEGYVADPTDSCHVAADMGQPAERGGMGIHYFRPDLLGITAPPNPRVNGNGTHVDWTRPSILIYEPRADGALELVAVENLVFRAAWHAAGNRERPSINGRSFDEMEDDPATEMDEAHGFQPHYDQHVWLYRENPRGMFEPFNPTVTCRHHRGGGHAGHGPSPSPSPNSGHGSH